MKCRWCASELNIVEIPGWGPKLEHPTPGRQKACKMLQRVWKKPLKGLEYDSETDRMVKP